MAKRPSTALSNAPAFGDVRITTEVPRTVTSAASRASLSATTFPLRYSNYDMDIEVYTVLDNFSKKNDPNKKSVIVKANLDTKTSNIVKDLKQKL